MDQFQRDVLELLRFSLTSPQAAAPLFFPMFRREEIQALYAIPLETRRRVWENRDRPRYRSVFRPPEAAAALGETGPE